MSRIAVFMLLLFAVAAPAAAQDASGPFRPHYVSQRVDRAYLREGPTFDHKILWVYRQRGYPFREIARVPARRLEHRLEHERRVARPRLLPQQIPERLVQRP